MPLGTDPLGNIIRLDNSLNNFPERITAAENELDTLHQQQAAAQIEVEKPFPQEEELAEKSARLAELKLYQKTESCSGSISIKCLKCGNVATVDLAYRRR